MDLRKDAMALPPEETPCHETSWPRPTRRAALRGGLQGALGLLAGIPLAGCAGGFPGSDIFSNNPPPPPAAQPGAAIGTGQVRVGLILPLSASGNAGSVGPSMKNAGELALAEFQNPTIQLLVKDDGGSAQGAQQGAQQALDEGAEIILGPVFSAAVPGAAQLARSRGVPMIAFSTDSTVAGRGVFLLSFLPESDVVRIVDYAASQGKRSFAAMIPENAYGSVVEAAFRQAASRRGRIVALEKYGNDPAQIQQSARTIAQALGGADALFLPDDGDVLPTITQALSSAGADLRRVQLLGTGLWDSPRVPTTPALQGGLYAAPDPAGFRAFAGRYRAKYGSEPVRTATLAYDAVALVAALARTQGQQRFAQEVLTSPSGFAGIDGLFRFRGDGSNERGLAVVRVTSTGPQQVAPPPKSFGA